LANTLRFSLTFDFGSESKNDNKWILE
jgi:hypothetical protein